MSAANASTDRSGRFLTNKSDVTVEVPESYARSGLLGMVVSSIGPAAAVVLTNPFDVAKTRLQMQNELRRANEKSPKVYKGPIDCLLKTYRNEGWRGVQRGLPICVIRDSTKSFWRLGLYAPLIECAHPNGRAPIWKRMVVGASCGMISAAICNPLDLAKVRVQTAGGLGVVHHHEIHSGFGAIKSILQKQGIRGLWLGSRINMLRSTVGSSVLLSSNSKTKEMLEDQGFEDGKARDAASSLLASLIMTYIINPMDVTRTRLYNQPRDPITMAGTMYNSVPDAMCKIVKTEGPLGLFKGSAAHYMRVGPYVVLSFIFIGILQRALRRRKAHLLSLECIDRREAVLCAQTRRKL